MTVKELIEKLQQFDGNAVVKVYGDMFQEGYLDVEVGDRSFTIMEG